MDLAPLHAIERPGALAVLAALHQRGEMTGREFATAADLSASPAMLLRVELVRLGLVTVDESPVRGATLYTIRLTDKGKRVADLAVRLLDILRGDETPEDRKRRLADAAQRSAAIGAVEAKARARDDETQR